MYKTYQGTTSHFSMNRVQVLARSLQRCLEDLLAARPTSGDISAA